MNIRKPRSRTASDHEFVTHLHAVLNNVFAIKRLKISEIASELGVSERHLQRRVIAVTGQTPSRYLCEYRLTRALDFLRTGLAIGDVAHAAGFSSHAYFAHRFKERFGVPPRQFRACALALNGRGSRGIFSNDQGVRTNDRKGK